MSSGDFAQVQQSLNGAIGMVRTAPRRMVSVEPFFMEFIAGVESVLSAYEASVLFAVTETIDAEIETYKRWAEAGLVSAVIVVNLAQDDPRPQILADLGLRAVLVGDPAGEQRFPAVFARDETAMSAVVDHLVAQGHSRVAHIAGPAEFRHTVRRSQVLGEAAQEFGFSVLTVHGDYSDTSGEALTRAVLEADPRPSAIIFDNDVMAVAGVHVLRSQGVVVPDEVAVVAWDDSPLCRLTQPPLTAATLDVFELGRLACGALLDDIAGVSQVEPLTIDAHLTVRESSL